MRSRVAPAGDRIARVDDGMFISSHRDDVHVGKVQHLRSGAPRARFKSSVLAFAGSASQAFLILLSTNFGPDFFI